MKKYGHHMQITYQLSLALLTIFGLLAAGIALSTRHRDIALWLGFLATIMAALSFFSWLQDYLWKQDAAAKTSAALSKRPDIFFVENKLIIPSDTNEPLRISFGLMNRGNADGIVKLWDQTYYFTVDSSQKIFKYQPSPPEEIPVPAVPNAIWHGEFRYNFQLTPHIIDGIKAGKARLFFYARGEYRDTAGNIYPLPVAEMFDPYMPRNLIAPPLDIIFE